MRKVAFARKFGLILIIVIIFNSSACGRVLEELDNQSETNKAEVSNSGSSKKQITLKLWHIWSTDSESNKKPFEKALNEWNENNPDIQIEAEATENETYKNKIMTSVAVNEAPDIFYSWGAGFAKPFVEAGKVLALDEYLNDGTKDRLVPRSLDYFTYNGKIYALPIYLIAGVFYCNKELLDKYEVKIPETYDELLKAIKILRKNGITPMAVGEKDRWPGMFYQNILAIRTAGTNLCNDALSKQAPFNRPEFVESAAKLRELIENGAFDSRCMDMTRDEAELEFKKGKVAMYYNGSWVAGSLDAEGCPVKGKIVVKNFPLLGNDNDDTKGFVGGAIDTFMVSANTKYKEEAVKALKTIDESFCRESYLSGASEPAWKIDVDTSEISPLAAEVTKLIKNSTGFVLAWDTYLVKPESETHKNLVADIFAGKRTPEEFAEEMQKLNDIN